MAHNPKIKCKDDVSKLIYIGVIFLSVNTKVREKVKVKS